MYGILANIVDFIHLIVIVFMLAGIVDWKSSRYVRVKIFHDYFCIILNYAYT